MPWSCQHHHAMVPPAVSAEAHSCHITASGPHASGPHTITVCPSCCISGNAMHLAPWHAGGQPAWFSSAALGKVHGAGNRLCCG